MISSYFLFTLGCKVNAYETHALGTELSGHGLREVADPSAADLIVVNTCSVTSKAGQKSRQHISSFRQKNPDAVLLVIGCYSQSFGEACQRVGADIVLGTSGRATAWEHIQKFLADKKRVIDVKPNVRHESYEELGAIAYCENARAYLKVQDGCDAFCSYCYIPQLRGNSRSRDPRAVVEEAQKLVAAGYREIVITGIHTGMYGKDLGGDYLLTDLLESILTKCPELKRLRISSLEENEINDAFLSLLRRYPAIVDHLHVPLQSGSDKVLRDMKRHYDTAGYLSALEKVRAIRPEIAITCDLIVGYPTETEEDFRDTMAFCERCGFAEIHVFPFSPRPNTHAATLKDLPGDVKKDRVRRMLALSKRLRKQYEERFYGRPMEVLVEEYDPATETVQGHTENYLLVRVKGSQSERGKFRVVTYESGVASD